MRLIKWVKELLQWVNETDPPICGAAVAVIVVTINVIDIVRLVAMEIANDLEIDVRIDLNNTLLQPTPI